MTQQPTIRIPEFVYSIGDYLVSLLTRYPVECTVVLSVVALAMMVATAVDLCSKRNSWRTR